MSSDYKLSWEATNDAEVLERSYGKVTRCCANSESTIIDDLRQTISDPVIFGHALDDTCWCGKMAGSQANGAICDECGVRVGSAEQMRRVRCGHIELPIRVQHPLFRNDTILFLPVLPIGLRSQAPMSFLSCSYENVIRICLSNYSKRILFERLSTAVSQLVCNEILHAPVTHDNAPIPSLLTCLVSCYRESPENVGVVLFSMGATIRPRN